jgi:hypothetical protein
VASSRCGSGLDDTSLRQRQCFHDVVADPAFWAVGLFAALNVATGEVLHQTRKRHSANEVLAFFKWIDLHAPQPLEVHVVLDNLSAHRAPRSAGRRVARAPEARAMAPALHPDQRLVAQPRRGLVRTAHQPPKQGTFTNVDGLVDAIEVWTSHWNDDPKPFVWHKPAKQIIAKVRRGRAALGHQVK